jgi:hypothetical protein
MNPTMQTTDTPQGYVDKPFVVTYQVQLNLAQQLQNQVIALDNDADFCLRNMYCVLFTPFTSFTFNFAGPQDYYYQTNQIPSFGLSQNSGQPFPVLPEVWYPAGGQIKINITNTNTGFGGPNTYALFFVGVKRFKVQL